MAVLAVAVPANKPSGAPAMGNDEILVEIPPEVSDPFLRFIGPPSSISFVSSTTSLNR